MEEENTKGKQPEALSGCASGIIIIAGVAAILFGVVKQSFDVGISILIIGFICAFVANEVSKKFKNMLPNSKAKALAVELSIQGDNLDDPDIEDDEEEEEVYFDTSIAGVSFRNDEKDFGGFLGFVRSDPTNEHDPNAIAIYRNDNKLIGYIPKEDIEEFRAWSHKDNLLCVGFMTNNQHVDIYGKVKIIDADKRTTKLEIVKYVAWLVSNFGVSFVPLGFRVEGRTQPRTKAAWLDVLYKYIDKCER